MATPALRCSISTWWMYSVALMSTPRVGCAAISTRGLRASSRARISFWMLPPERFFAGRLRVGRLDVEAADQVRGVAC